MQARSVITPPARQRQVLAPAYYPGVLPNWATVEFRTFHGMAGLLKIREEWNAVVRAMSHAQHFHQYAWFDAYARHLVTDPSALHFVVAYRQCKPVGVFPLANGTRTIGGLPVRTLALSAHPQTALGDFVFEPRPQNSGLVASVVDYLRGEPDSWDVLVAPGLLEDSAALFSINGRRPWCTVIEEATPCDFFDDTPYAARLSMLSKDFRSTLRKARTKLARQEHVEFVRATDPQALSVAFDDFVGVENSRFVAFYRAILDGFAATGGVEINLLRVAGRCIAAQFCVKVDRRLDILATGYREEHSRLEPGNMLLENVVKRALARGEVDTMTLPSHAAWHGDWRPQTHRRFTAYVFNQTLRGTMSYGAMLTKDRLRPAYRRFVRPFLDRRAPKEGDRENRASSI
jgi:Acetyltransferase (GNAT) domain